MEEMREIPIQLLEKSKLGNTFLGVCEDVDLDIEMQGMLSSFLHESCQVIPHKNAMEIFEEDITMVGLDDVWKPLIHINENTPKKEFEGLQESHLDGVKFLGNDNEQTIINS